MSRLSTSGPHRSSLRRRSRGALALLLLALAVLALAVPWKAQAEVLVSNLNQPATTGPFSFSSGGTQFGIAQGFTTGANSGGYTLASIEIAFASDFTATEVGDLTAGVWSDDGSGTPSAELFTLTKPASIVAATRTAVGFDSNLTGNYTVFDAPVGTALGASTQYHVYLAGSSSRVFITVLDVETGASNWSIANAGNRKQITPTPGNWVTHSGASISIRVNGAVATNNPPTAANNTVTTGVGTAYTFEADDFGFADTNAGDTLASVKIVTLPAVGTLAFDGTDVTLNQAVTRAAIDDNKLIFTPVAGASGTGYATFTFKVNDGMDDSASAYTMTIDVTTCVAPDLAGRERIWTGELTVGAGPPDRTASFYGFDSTYITGFFVGALDHPTFNTGPNAYTFQAAYVLENIVFHGDLQIRLNTALTDAEKDALRLHVCDTPYDFSAAMSASGRYTWTDNLDWSSFSSRTLHLSLPAPPAPVAPSGLSAQPVSGKPGYLRLSWTTALVVGLPSIPTDYEARYRKTGATNWSPTWSFRDYGTPGFPYPPTTHAVPRGGNDAPLIYYLDPNTQYDVQVRATNSYGQSGWSNQVSATTAQATTAIDDDTADADNESGPAAAPSQPTVRRVANQPGLMVRWNAPRTPSSDTPVAYQVEIEKERERDRRITTLNKRYLYLVESVDGGTTPPLTYLLIPGLERNTAYTVRVRVVYQIPVLVEGFTTVGGIYSAWSPDTSGTTAAGRANNIRLSLEYPDGTRSTTAEPGDEVTYRVKATGIHDWAAVRARGGVGKARIRIWERARHGHHYFPYSYYQSTKGITYRHFIQETASSVYLEGAFTVPDEAGAGASGTIEIQLVPPSSCRGRSSCTVGSVSTSTNKLCIAVDRSGTVAHPCSSGQTQDVAPTVEGTPGLSASGSDGSWAPGETVEAIVTFSETVTVDTSSGTPSITLTLGGTLEQSARYTRGSGTKALVFVYTLIESDGSHTAMGVSPDSLALNGGSITSEATGAEADLRHNGAIIMGERDGGTGPRGTRGVPERTGPTASFSDLPATHDGEKPFTVKLSFSAEPRGLSYKTVRDSLLEVSCATESCGTVTGASRVTKGNDSEWKVTVKPSQAYDITLTLPVRACSETAAVCVGGRPLSRAASATIPGRPLTATLTHRPGEDDVRGEHKGSGTFEVRLAFNTEPRMSYKTVRDTMFDVTGGTITGARRVTRGKNQHFDIVVKPSGNDAVTFSLHSPLPACGETGSVCTEAGRMVEGPVSATVLGPVAISVADASVTEGADAVLAFAVTLDRERETDVTVDYATGNGTATAGEDYVAQSGDLTFAAGETAKTVEVEVLDDLHDEGTETMTLTLLNPSGARIADATATGSIENIDPMPKAWMVRFGRTVGSQVVDALGQRLAGGQASHVTVAGVPLTGGAAPVPEDKAGDAFGLPEWAKDARREQEARTITADDLLLRSAFHLSSGSGEAQGPAFTTWGRVSTGGFDAEVDDVTTGGDVTMDGDVTTGLLGFDAEWDNLLAGVMLSQSTGEGAYRPDPAQGPAGTVKSDLTGVYPYARINLDARVSAWALAGAGSGSITLTQDGHDTMMKTDLSMRMGALGVKGQVLDGTGPSGMRLDLKSDAMWVGTKSAHLASMKGSQGDVTRLRLVAQGERDFVLAEQGRLTSSAELGLRHDGGDAETGMGVELGAGLRYMVGSFTIEARARTLVAHEASGYEEWGASAAVGLTPGASGRGLSLSIAPTWGRTGSASERLWSARDAGELEGGGGGGFEADGRIEAQLGYGAALPHNRGLLTPYGALTLGSEGGRTMRGGARWTVDSDLAVTLDATRTESAGAEAENEVRVQAALRF